MEFSFRKAASLTVLMAQRMVLCAQTWTWLILSLDVIQKSQAVNVNNLTICFVKKTYVYMSNKFFNKDKIKTLS